MRIRSIICLSLVIAIIALCISCNPEPQQYSVSLNPENGQALMDIRGVEGQNISLPNPTKEGFSFDGWYDEAGNRYGSVFTIQSKDIRLNARWIARASITGRVCVPEGVNLESTDIFVKTSDGKVVQVGSDGSFEIFGLKTDTEYSLFFSSNPPSNIVFSSRTLKASGYGAYVKSIRTESNGTVDTGTITIKPTGTTFPLSSTIDCTRRIPKLGKLFFLFRKQFINILSHVILSPMSEENNEEDNNPIAHSGSYSCILQAANRSPSGT